MMRLPFIIVTLFFSTSQLLSQTELEEFNVKADQFFAKYVTSGKVNYAAIKSNNADLKELVSFIEIAKLDSLVGSNRWSYLINVYNLSVINQLVFKYPVKSPLDIKGFFDLNKFNLGGNRITLNQLENDILRKELKNPRIHFVLVCGALGCPVILNRAYKSDSLDIQLDTQTSIAINNTKFIYTKENTIYVSEIFKWYKEDFGTGSKAVLSFINNYRGKKFDTNSKIDYYPYSWLINEFKGPVNEKIAIEEELVEIGAKQDDSVVVKVIPVISEFQENSNQEALLAKMDTTLIVAQSLDSASINLQTYTAGTLLYKGQFDFTLFNSIYTETRSNWLGENFNGNRTTLFTSSLQVLYGISKSRRVNVGIEVNLKTSARSSSARFSDISNAFTLENNSISRFGIANVGLRAKIVPFKSVDDFSIQTTFYFPTIKNPEGYTNPDGSGNGDLTWSDWNRYVSWTQFFYTKSYTKSQFFAEVDFLYRRRVLATQIDHVDLPLTFIYSYFPTNRWTVYGIGQHSTRFLYDIQPQESNDWLQPSNYSTLGMGVKYQPKSNITMELLYTNFVRGVNTGLGSTINFGIKILTL